jgi:hypothetical protein
MEEKGFFGRLGDSAKSGASGAWAIVKEFFLAIGEQLGNLFDWAKEKITGNPSVPDVSATSTTPSPTTYEQMAEQLTSPNSPLNNAYRRPSQHGGRGYR